MGLLNRLKKSRQLGNFIVFILMTLPSIGLFIAAKAEAVNWIWILIGMVILGNITALLLK